MASFRKVEHLLLRSIKLQNFCPSNTLIFPITRVHISYHQIDLSCISKRYVWRPLSTRLLQCIIHEQSSAILNNTWYQYYSSISWINGAWNNFLASRYNVVISFYNVIRTESAVIYFLQFYMIWYSHDLQLNFKHNFSNFQG